MKNRRIVVSDGKKNISILIYLLAFICSLCLPPGSALADLAGFQNGNFSNGFAGWSGNLIFTGNVDPSSDPHFSITPQGAQIQNNNLAYMVTLYQDFRMNPLNSANSIINLNYWLQWTLTADEQEPNITAILYEYDPITQEMSNRFDLLQNIPMPDLLQGTQASCDVTSFANRPVRLAFTIADTDFSTPDYMTVGYISFIQHDVTPIPIPAGWLLLLSGVAFFAAFRKNPRSQLPEN